MVSDPSYPDVFREGVHFLSGASVHPLCSPHLTSIKGRSPSFPPHVLMPDLCFVHGLSSSNKFLGAALGFFVLAAQTEFPSVTNQVVVNSIVSQVPTTVSVPSYPCYFLCIPSSSHPSFPRQLGGIF